jgi:hypothetical protein
MCHPRAANARHSGSNRCPGRLGVGSGNDAELIGRFVAFTGAVEQKVAG